MQPFVHLHVHSYYSVLDGQSSIEGLIETAKADGMPGIALTDHGAMFGIKNFVDAPKKIQSKKIKSIEKKLEYASEKEREKLLAEIDEWKQWKFKTIIGCECYVAARGRLKKETDQDRSGYHLIVLAKNLQGYKNLIKMVSQSYNDGMYYRPRIDKELLEKYHEGLIVLSACLGGEVPRHIRNGQIDQARQTILWFKEIFGEDYYLEVQRHKTDKIGGNRETFEVQTKVNEVIFQLAKEMNVKVVATNDVHFLRESDGEAHDRLICVSTNKSFNDPNRMTYTKQEWLKSTAEMNAIFADVPETLAHSMEIFNKIEEYSINHSPLMPDFPIPDDFADADDYLRHLSYEGAKKRYNGEISEEVMERLDFELETIKGMGFPGYFLIVQDFISKARELGVSVGPGRGSAAGSLVSYCLRITDLDPLKYDLLFERFLNPERISLPDIDIDFDDDGRQEILKWVTDHYGARNVAHIVTYGTMAAKSSIKDVGRVLGLPLNETNMLAKLIPDRMPNGDKVNIKNALEQIPDLREIYYGKDPLKKDVLEYAKQLEGTVRNTGVHACGIIIGKSAIDDVVPTWVTKDSDTGEDILVTQYEGSVIESTGLIKMDFLGLKTLSIIRATLVNIKKRHGVDLNIDTIPMDDPKTFQLFCEGKTHAVFQFESPGMQKSLRQLKPGKFEDLIAMVALYRPGPMDYIPSFIARKHGEEEIHYDLDIMEEFLKETYGITVYQEQVMLLSRKIAGFTRGESDSLRKAMGKKIIEQMNALKDKFIAGGKKNGHAQPILEKIWADWEKFASYAFNKSHAACYAWLAYQTAYLKANYPAEFMAGVMSRNVNNITEITKYIDESKKMGIAVFNPDINESDYFFSVNEQGDIRFGLGAIKGFSRSAANTIVEEREKNGPYTDIYNFFERVDSRVATKKVCESLVLSGGFDSFGTFRREDFFMTSEHKEETFLDRLIKFGQKSQTEKAQAQCSLFGVDEFQEMAKPTLDVKAQPWSDIERLNKEKELLGFYLTASPLDRYALLLRYRCNTRCADLTPDLLNLAGKEISFGGIVVGYREIMTQKGTPAGFIKIQDYEGEGELALFGDQFPKFSIYGKEGLFIYVKANVEMGRKQDRAFMKVQSISLLDDIHDKLIKELCITLPSWAVNEDFYNDIVPDLLNLDHGNKDILFTIIDPSKRIYLNMESVKLQKVDIPVSLIDKLVSYDETGVKFELR